MKMSHKLFCSNRLTDRKKHNLLGGVAFSKPSNCIKLIAKDILQNQCIN